MYACVLCQKVFTHLKNYKSHINKDVPCNFVCKRCGEFQGCRTTYQRHVSKPDCEPVGRTQDAISKLIKKYRKTTGVTENTINGDSENESESENDRNDNDNRDVNVKDITKKDDNELKSSNVNNKLSRADVEDEEDDSSSSSDSMPIRPWQPPYMNMGVPRPEQKKSSEPVPLPPLPKIPLPVLYGSSVPPKSTTPQDLEEFEKKISVERLKRFGLITVEQAKDDLFRILFDLFTNTIYKYYAQIDFDHLDKIVHTKTDEFMCEMIDMIYSNHLCPQYINIYDDGSNEKHYMVFDGKTFVADCMTKEMRNNRVLQMIMYYMYNLLDIFMETDEVFRYIRSIAVPRLVKPYNHQIYHDYIRSVFKRNSVIKNVFERENITSSKEQPLSYELCLKQLDEYRVNEKYIYELIRDYKLKDFDTYRRIYEREQSLNIEKVDISTADKNRTPFTFSPNTLSSTSRPSTSLYDAPRTFLPSKPKPSGLDFDQIFNNSSRNSDSDFMSRKYPKTKEEPLTTKIEKDGSTTITKNITIFANSDTPIQEQIETELAKVMEETRKTNPTFMQGFDPSIVSQKLSEITSQVNLDALMKGNTSGIKSFAPSSSTSSPSFSFNSNQSFNPSSFSSTSKLPSKNVSTVVKKNSPAKSTGTGRGRGRGTRTNDPPTPTPMPTPTQTHTPRAKTNINGGRMGARAPVPAAAAPAPAPAPSNGTVTKARGKGRPKANSKTVPPPSKPESDSMKILREVSETFKGKK